MKVAWQFTAWNAFTKRTRPVGHGLSWSTDASHGLPLAKRRPVISVFPPRLKFWHFARKGAESDGRPSRPTVDC